MTRPSLATDLHAVLARYERARNELDRIAAAGGPAYAWNWSIPANPDRDTDLILEASLTDIPELMLEIKRLRKRNHG
jgi:hypothetical protein